MPCGREECGWCQWRRVEQRATCSFSPAGRGVLSCLVVACHVMEQLLEILGCLRRLLWAVPVGDGLLKQSAGLGKVGPPPLSEWGVVRGSGRPSRAGGTKEDDENSARKPECSVLQQDTPHLLRSVLHRKKPLMGKTLPKVAPAEATQRKEARDPPARVVISCVASLSSQRRLPLSGLVPCMVARPVGR